MMFDEVNMASYEAPLLRESGRLASLCQLTAHHGGGAVSYPKA